MNELARFDPLKAGFPSLLADSAFDIMPTLFRPLTRAAAWVGPRMDVVEDENAYYLAVELPGIGKDSIQVGVYENSVTISAEAKQEQEAGQERNWLLRERSFGKFQRNLTLPEDVEEDASEARYVDGVLYLTLKKKRASRIKRLTVN